ncbi:MAG: hypothetical protein ABI488_23005 [Polyangiaceae bacterium]
MATASSLGRFSTSQERACHLVHINEIAGLGPGDVSTQDFVKANPFTLVDVVIIVDRQRHLQLAGDDLR